MLCVSNASLIMQIQLSPNQVKQAFVLMCVCVRAGLHDLRKPKLFSRWGKVLDESQMALALHVMENTQIWSAGFVFTCTRSHRMRNWCCVTYEFSFVYKSRRNPPMRQLCKCWEHFQLHNSCFLTPPVLLSSCLSSSWLHAEGSWWRTPTMPHSSSPYRTGPQVPLTTSSSRLSLPYAACRGECRAAPSGHHCPSLWSEYNTEGEFTSPIPKILILRAGCCVKSALHTNPYFIQNRKCII